MSESPSEPGPGPEGPPTEDPEIVPSSPTEGGALPVGPAEIDPDPQADPPAL